MSKKHKLALTVLRYGLDSHALITVVTGDIGCGKTTLVRKLIGEARDDITIGLITNTHSAFGDPLKLALLAFDLKYESKTNTERYETLVDFIINEYAQRRHTVLIVDEAQNLDESALEELRMLSNINVDSHHILQLVLVGQPELRDTLNQPELKQFAQRVSADYHILPLSLEEIAAYIQHRLKVVEGDPHIFLPETYPLIHEHSSGVPRLVNILCDTALVYAYGSEKKQIDEKLIKEVIKHRESGVYFQDGQSTSIKPKGVRSSEAVRAKSIISNSSDKTVATSEDRASMEMAFKRQDGLGPKKRNQSVKKTPTKKKASVASKIKQVQEGTQKTPHAAQTEQAAKSFPQQPRNAKKNIGSNEREGDVKPTFSTIQPPTREAVKSNTQSKVKIIDTTKPWGKKVVVSLVALSVSIGALYLYQNPDTIDAFKQRIEHAKIQSLLAESNKYLDADQLIEPVGANAHEVLYKVLERDPNNSAAQAQLAAIKDKFFAISMQIQGVVSESKRFLKSKQVDAPDSANAYEAFSKILESAPGDIEAQAAMNSVKDNLYALAISVQNQGNWDQARSQLQALLQLSPQSERAKKLLVTVDEAQAVEVAELETQTRIDNWLSQATNYLKANQLTSPEGESAAALYLKVLEQDASNPKAQAGIEQIRDQLFENATTAQTEGNWELARNQLQSLMQISPHGERGQKLLVTLDEAQAAEQAEIETQTRIENWLAQADSYVDADRVTSPESDNAVAMLNKVLEQDSSNTQALAGIEKIKDQLFENATAAQTAGNWDQARDLLRTLLQIETNHQRGQKLLATVNEAQTAEHAEIEAQTRVDNWLAQADKYVKANQITSPEGDNAVAVLNKVLAQDAGNQQAQASLEEIKDKLFNDAMKAQTDGDWDKARSQLQVLMQVSPLSERGKKQLTAVDEAQAAEQAKIAAQTRIKNWLVQADKYLMANQLIAPESDNAYVLFNKVLEQDSANATAAAGIAKIKDQLFSAATDAKALGDWDQARGQLQSLMKIESNNDRGAQLLTAVNDARAAEQAAVEAKLQLENWLAQAYEYIKTDQLTSPVGENAYSLFSQVLKQDASNRQALSGIKLIKDQLFTTANEAQARDNWDQARDQLQSLLEIESNSVRAQKLLAAVDEAQAVAIAGTEAQIRIDNWLAQADEYVTANQFISPEGKNAIALFNKVLEQDAGNKQAQSGIEQVKNELFSNASNAQTLGNWAQARSQLQSLLQISPQSKRGQNLLATVNESQAIEQAETEAQTKIDSWLVRADEYIKANQLTAPDGENAYALFNQVLEQDGGNEQAQLGIGQIKDQLFDTATTAQISGNWEQARNQLLSLMQISPQSERGQKLLATINKAQAVEQAEVEVQIKIAIWLHQASEFIESNQLVTPEGENAYALFTQVLQIDVNNQKALEGIGAIEGKLFVLALKAQQQGDWDLARRQLEALIRIDSNNKQSQQALLDVNRAQAAEQAQVEARGQIRDWLDKAQVHFDNGELLKPAQNNAYENYYKVLEQSPDDVAALAGMQAIKDLLFEQSVTLQKQGDWEKARTQLQALIQIEPQSERGWEALEKVTIAQQEQDAERAQIQNWMKKANEHAQNGQLLEPVGANALELYSKILEYAPENVNALAGMELVKSKLFTDAEVAQSQGNWGVARGKLWALLQIDSKNQAATRALTELAAAQQAADTAEAKPQAEPEAEPEAVPVEQAQINQPTETTPPADQSEIDQELLDIFQSGGASLPLPQVIE